MDLLLGEKRTTEGMFEIVPLPENLLFRSVISSPGFLYFPSSIEMRMIDENSNG